MRSGILSYQSLFLLTIVPFIVLFYSCSKESSNPADPGNEAAWKYGQTKTYNVSAVTGKIIKDTLSGYEFMFPSGGSGSLTVSKIELCPAAPFEGVGYKIDFNTSNTFKILIRPETGARILAMTFGKLDCLTNGEYKDSWLGIPATDTIEGKIAFTLPQPFQLAKSAGRPRGSDIFWFSQIKPGMTKYEKMVNIELQARTFIDKYLAALPSAVKTAAQKKIDSKPLSFSYGEKSYYSGFWKPLGNLAPWIYHPTVNYTLTDKEISGVSTIGHELGHYLTHMITGDNAQQILESQGSIFDNHGIREKVGRSYLVEEFAYFTESFFCGTGGNYDLSDPSVIFGGLSPTTTDFPGLEGFGAVMLSALVRTDPSIKNLYNRSVTEDIPVIGLPYGKVFEIISKGATEMDPLRNNIEAYIGAAEAQKLPAILQRIGWSYSVKGRLIDNSNNPLEGFTVKCISKAGTKEYSGGWTNIPTGNDGIFSITGDAFGGNSILRFTKGTDNYDVPVSISWTNLTNAVVDLKDVKLTGLVLIPSITSINPEQGKVGDQVIITGTNFGTDKTKGFVTFNTVQASSADIVSWTNTQIVVKVSSGAATGPLSVTLNGKTSNSKTFTVTSAPAPVISAIAPNPATAGQKVTITGSNFGTDQTKGEVLFGAISVKSFLSWTNTQIEVNVPSSAVTGNVIVKVDGKSSNSYSLSIEAAPVITSIEPATAKQGDVVYIKGNNFGSDYRKGEVWFSGTNGSIQASYIGAWSNTSIRVTVPTGAQTGNIQVKVNDILSNGFMFNVIGPTITSISPDFQYGGQITIKGENLNYPIKAKINTLEVAASLSGTTTATISLPIDIPGGMSDISLICGGMETNKLKYFLGIPQSYLNSITKVKIEVQIPCYYIAESDGKKSTSLAGQINEQETQCVWSGSSFTITVNNQYPSSGESLTATMKGTVSSDGLSIKDFVLDYNMNYSAYQQVFKCKVSEIKMTVDKYSGIQFVYIIRDADLVSKTTEAKGTHVNYGRKWTIDGVSTLYNGFIRINVFK